VRLVRSPTNSPTAVYLIIGIITGKPSHFTVTLKCKNMSGYSVEKPPVMTDNDRASGESAESVL
jgi:hypothetical protein